MASGRVRDVEPPRLRADARRNRRLLLDAAASIFAVHGAKVPMERIAKAAGVGVGTLYRHFPDRGSLLNELAVTRFTDLHAQGVAAAREESTAWAALVRFCDSAQNLRLLVRLSPSVPEESSLTHNDPEMQKRRRAVMELMDGLVVAAQAEGSMRRDVGTGDVAVMLALVLHNVPTMTDKTAELSDGRTIRLMLDGLRTQTVVDPPLPGRAITADDLFGR